VGKSFPPDELAWRTFVISMVGVVAWIVAAFVFIILRNP
jgi:hypothetical protein